MSCRDNSIAQFLQSMEFDLAPALGDVDPFSRVHLVDHTGLTGTFDFTLEFRQRFDDPNSDSPDVFSAMEKQLGLRLQKAGSIPLQVLVIDHADRIPTEN